MLRLITEDGDPRGDEDDGTEKPSSDERKVAPRRDFWSGVIFDGEACMAALRANFKSTGIPWTSVINEKPIRCYHRTSSLGCCCMSSFSEHH